MSRRDWSQPSLRLAVAAGVGIVLVAALLLAAVPRGNRAAKPAPASAGPAAIVTPSARPDADLPAPSPVPSPAPSPVPSPVPSPPSPGAALTPSPSRSPLHAAAGPPRAAPPAQGPSAGAPAPPGAPATTVARTTSGLLFDSNRTGNYEIFRSATDGSGLAQLTADRSWDSFWPKISPDHRQVLFYRTPAGVHDNNYTTASLWMMNADGTGQHVMIPVGANGWGFQAHAEWSPDGTRLAMIGGSAPNQQIYLTDADGSRPRLLTTDGHGGPRPGVNLDPSWGPDGHTLLFIGCDAALCLPAQQEVYRISADGTGERRLTADSSPDYDPYFSADGTRIAWLRDNSILILPRWGIMMMNADGSNQHVLIDDGGINSKPNWSPDSSAIYFHRLPPGSGVFSVYRIPSAGGTPTGILPELGLGAENEYPDAY